eukprot:948503_1
MLNYLANTGVAALGMVKIVDGDRDVAVLGMVTMDNELVLGNMAKEEEEEEVDILDHIDLRLPTEVQIDLSGLCHGLCHEIEIDRGSFARLPLSIIFDYTLIIFNYLLDYFQLFAII